MLSLCFLWVFAMPVVLLDSGTGAFAQSEMETFVAAFNEANLKRKEASRLGHEWRDTAKILRNAKKAAEAGNLDEAMEYVEQARLQSEMAIVQAQREEKLWRGRIIR